MSEHVYTFKLSIGYPSAEQEETFDLIDDLGHDAEELADPNELAAVLECELRDWQWQYVEAWTEKVDE